MNCIVQGVHRCLDARQRIVHIEVMKKKQEIALRIGLSSVACDCQIVDCPVVTKVPGFAVVFECKRMDVSQAYLPTRSAACVHEDDRALLEPCEIVVLPARADATV